MPLAQLITVPIPENLPFVNKRFHDFSRQYRDQRMDITHRNGMGDVRLQVAIKGLSLDNFDLIISVLKPQVAGAVALNADQLTTLSRELGDSFRNHFSIKSDQDDYCEEHLKAYVLSSAVFEKNADWRKIARRYNESPDDQKQAFEEFFLALHAISLEHLMSAGSPELSLPEGLPLPQTKEVDGDLFVYCELIQDWRLDDAYFRRFEIKVDAVFPNMFDSLAYAGTLEQAIAKAIAITLPHNGHVLRKTDKEKKRLEDTLKLASGFVSIKLNCEESSGLVSNASLVRSAKYLDDDTAIQDCRLEWGNCWTGNITEQRFRKALYTTEKLFGVQWSKVRHLDDALGL
jgi:hypothetical protein